jgi:hypothetical protein
VKIETLAQRVSFRKGDWLIPYFSWNFFDPILVQKEGYSAYSFEDKAADYLRTDTILQRRLNERKSADPEFAKSGRAQLDFIYRNSPWAEPGFMRYPVYRITK